MHMSNVESFTLRTLALAGVTLLIPLTLSAQAQDAPEMDRVLAAALEHEAEWLADKGVSRADMFVDPRLVPSDEDGSLVAEQEAPRLPSSFLNATGFETAAMDVTQMVSCQEGRTGCEWTMGDRVHLRFSDRLEVGDESARVSVITTRGRDASARVPTHTVTRVLDLQKAEGTWAVTRVAATAMTR